MSEQQPFEGPSPTGADAEEVDPVTKAKAANRFDIRRIIGALFLLYGVILVVTGVVGSHAVRTKAAGVNVDLWTGLAMLVVGGLMIAWALWRPVVARPEAVAGR